MILSGETRKLHRTTDIAMESTLDAMRNREVRQLIGEAKADQNIQLLETAFIPNVRNGRVSIPRYGVTPSGLAVMAVRSGTRLLVGDNFTGELARNLNREFYEWQPKDQHMSRYNELSIDAMSAIAVMKKQRASLIKTDATMQSFTTSAEISLTVSEPEMYANLGRKAHFVARVRPMIGLVIRSEQDLAEVRSTAPMLLTHQFEHVNPLLQQPIVAYGDARLTTAEHLRQETTAQFIELLVGAALDGIDLHGLAA